MNDPIGLTRRFLFLAANATSGSESALIVTFGGARVRTSQNHEILNNFLNKREKLGKNIRENSLKLT